MLKLFIYQVRTLVFLVSLQLGVLSKAEIHSDLQCLRWETGKTVSNVVAVSPCEYHPPILKEKSFTYDQSPLPQRVDYWDGGYQRVLTVENQTEFFLVNHCDQYKGEVVQQYTRFNQSFENLYFKFSNPNLVTNLKYSFLKSPLMREEVEHQKPELEQRCNNFNLEASEARPSSDLNSQDVLRKLLQDRAGSFRSAHHQGK